MEELRLEALRSYELLDTPPHPSFDAITEAARLAFDVDMAAISLIDEDRQWFKSSFGLDVRETPRSHAFCTHTIDETGPLVVEDTHLDPRFCDHPNVTGGLNLRFYAGAPLIDHEGFALGTLCVFDVRPRPVASGEVALLRALAECAMTAITAHHQGRLLRKAARAVAQVCPNEPVLI